MAGATFVVKGCPFSCPVSGVTAYCTFFLCSFGRKVIQVSVVVLRISIWDPRLLAWSARKNMRRACGHMLSSQRSH